MSYDYSQEQVLEPSAPPPTKDIQDDGMRPGEVIRPQSSIPKQIPGYVGAFMEAFRKNKPTSQNTLVSTEPTQTVYFSQFNSYPGMDADAMRTVVLADPALTTKKKTKVPKKKKRRRARKS